MQLEERCSSSHGSSKTKGGTAGARAAHLSCDLRDQAPVSRRSPSVGDPEQGDTALQSPPETPVQGCLRSAVLLPERFRAETCAFGVPVGPDSLRTDLCS